MTALPKIALLAAALPAAALLAACNAPQPEVPDEPPTPRAASPALPEVSRPGRPERASRLLDRTPATPDMPDMPPSGTDNPVWKEAAARGVALRAVGQEPGWYVEVAGGDTPALHAVLDYAERTLDVATVEALGQNRGYRGTAGDGTEVIVRTSDGPCFDGMSGHRFPAKVELTVGDRTYDGCGAYLQAAP